MPFLLAKILNFQGTVHLIGVGSLSELYTPEELKPYFDKAFDEFIMPPLLEGKETVLKIMEYYDDYTLEEKENIIKKLQLDQ